MCGDAVALPWAAPNFGAVSPRPGPSNRARARSRKRAELSLGALVAMILLAFIPAQGGVSTRPSTAGGSAAASTTPAANSGGDYLVGSLKTTSLAVQLAEQEARVQLSDLPDSQVPPSVAGLDTVGTSDLAGGAGPGPESQPEIVGDRPANTAKPAPIVAKPAVVAAATPGPAPQPLASAQLYKKDLYDGSLVRYQDPDMTACTATATQLMLNFTASQGVAGGGFVWQPTTSYGVQEDILAWERANDTLESGAPGSDPHGWRNALNYYGWSDFTSPGTRHYEDLAYSSYASAVKAAVVAIATENQPVGILGWAGGHAQIMTGYEVYGGDPARLVGLHGRGGLSDRPAGRRPSPRRSDRVLRLRGRPHDLPLPALHLARQPRRRPLHAGRHAFVRRVVWQVGHRRPGQHLVRLARLGPLRARSPLPRRTVRRPAPAASAGGAIPASVRCLRMPGLTRSGGLGRLLALSPVEC